MATRLTRLKMNVLVEFYGIPRSRTGVSEVALNLDASEATLGGIVSRIAQQFPDFAADCVLHDRLLSTVAANVNGEQFIGDPAFLLRDGDTLLILSSDAGG